VWRLINSAFYVAPNFLASIIVVSIISNSIGEIGRINFFLYLSLFSPFTSIAGQTRAIQTLNDRSINTGSKLDIIVFITTCVLIFLYIGNDINFYELLILGLSVILSYRASTELVKTQLIKANKLSSFLPIITSICRVGLCWLFVSKGFAISFFASSLIFYLIPKLFNLICNKNNQRNSKYELNTSSAKAHSTKLILLCLIFFVISTTFYFQWDRYVLQSKGLFHLINNAGVYAIWALSPTGLIFSTVYRSEPSMIFKQQFDWKTYRFIIKKFLILVLLYLAALFVSWNIINDMLFPFFSGSLWIGLLLIFAVIVDRMSNLFIYMSGQAKHYLLLSCCKFSLIATSIIYFSFYAADISLSTIYSCYLCVSIIAFFVSLFLVSFDKKTRQKVV